MSEMQTPAPAPMASDVNDNDKLMALLAYLLTPLGPAIVLLSESNKARPYQKYHATQALGLFGAELVLYVLMCILYFVCTLVTFGLGAFLFCIFFLPIIPSIYYAYVAYTKLTYFEIPVVTQFMIGQKWLTKP